MKVTPLTIPDVLLIDPSAFSDDREFFLKILIKKLEKLVGRSLNMKLLNKV
jgi:dTDP-4-dehydrorhamnose 3,5-epimerase-like enzyme